MYCSKCGGDIGDSLVCAHCGATTQRKIKIWEWFLGAGLIGGVLIILGVAADTNPDWVPLFIFALNLVTTGVFYCTIPTIVRLATKKPMEKKRATRYATINSIVIYLLFTIIYALIYIYANTDMTGANMTAAVVWFFAARAILRYGHEPDEAKIPKPKA